MLNKIRSTKCYKINSILGYLAFVFLCVNLLLSPLIARLEIAAILLIPVYCIILVSYVNIFSLLTICQFIEQKFIKQHSSNIIFDVGYVFGLILVFLILVFLVIIFSTNNS